MQNLIIYSDNQLTEGLFGMIILCLFAILPKLETVGVNVSRVKWIIRTDSYGYIFPSILEYNSDFLNLKDVKDTDIICDLNLGLPDYALGDNFEKLNYLFFKYFKIPDELESVADSFNLNEYFGVHFRGTDKTIDIAMNDPVTESDFLTILDSYISTNKIKKIFLATDSNNFYLCLKEKYSDIDIKTSRDLNGNLFWRGNTDLNNGKQAMIDMLCLSKCNSVLKVSSALSSFSKVINPKLKIYRVNSLKMFMDIPYFPDAYIPLLEPSDDYEDECNIILKNIQKNDWSKSNHKENFRDFVYKVK